MDRLRNLPLWIRAIEGAPAGAPAAPAAPAVPPSTAEAAPSIGAPADDKGPAGGVEALRAELAEERRQRQALQKAQEGTISQEAFAKAFAALTGQEAPAELTAESVMAQFQEYQAEQAKKDAANQTRLVSSEVKAVAGRLNFHNAADAISKIDLSKVPVNDEGEVDSAHIETELKKVAEQFPYLVNTAGVPPVTAAAVGVGGTGGGQAPAKGKARLANHYGSTTK